MVGITKTHGQIGRSLRKTRIIGQRAAPDNSLEDFDVIIDGNFQNIERANIAAAKYFGTNRLIVREIHHGKVFASISLEDFLKLAKLGDIVWED